MKDYYQVRNWLEGFIPYTYSKDNLGLERIKYLLELLGNPQEKFKSILVGGTSGKGSTAFYLARGLEVGLATHQLAVKKRSASFYPESESSFPPRSRLRKIVTNNTRQGFDKILLRHVFNKQADSRNPVLGNTGIKVGLHISPHLTYIGERMRVFQRVRELESERVKEVSGPIAVGRLVGLINEIYPVVEAIKSKQPYLTPSYFEILVSASFLYFAKEKVDFAVVEVGLGGRLDATNVLQPVLSIITNVGLDHTDILGKTIEKIAKEKAGIVKRGKELEGERVKEVSVVTESKGKALEVIEKVAKEKNAPLITISTLKAGDRVYYDLLLNIKAHIDDVNGGKFQVTNECFFLVNLALNQLGIRLSENKQRKIFSAGFEGRFEQIDDGIIIDGAHNRDKARALIFWVKNKYMKSERVKELERITLVCGFKKGKDWKGILRLLLRELDRVSIYATQFVTPTDTGFFTSVDPQEVADYICQGESLTVVKTFENSQEAVWEAVNERDKSYKGVKGAGGLVLVTGSLYLAGEARTVWKLPSF